MAQITLETQRMNLREYVSADWKSVHLYSCLPNVVEYQAWGPNTELETKQFIDLCIQEQKQTPRNTYNLAITLKGSQIVIGGCRAFIQDTQNEAEIGFTLSPSFWNQGYATEAAEALITFLFKLAKMHRIFATCRPENIGSTKALKKLRMRQEGHLLENTWVKGVWSDSLLFAVLNREWPKK